MAEVIPMGIGVLGFKNLRFKRKFRFTFELEDICLDTSGEGDPNSDQNTAQRVPRHFVKVAARPNLAIEETEINFLNAKTWIPGKAAWETITVTYIDVGSEEMAPLYNWLASVYDFTDPINLRMGSTRNQYAATGIIKMWDGCGGLLESWRLDDVWPTSVNFGDLDYSNSEEATIELTLRYSNVEYTPECPGFPITPCCSPCDNGGTPETEEV